MAQLTGALLGQIQIRRNEQQINGFAYEKVRALLIYLWVESERCHHRDTLAALLWPDACDARARTNLRKALATLRSTIGDHEEDTPLLLATRDTIQFNPNACNMLDVTVFRKLIAEADAHEHANGALCEACIERLEAAVQLYQGEFLAQIGTRESALFTEWAAATREQLHQMAVSVLSQLAAIYEYRGEVEKAERTLRRMLVLEPWDEEAHRALMRVLAQRGQRGAALQQYERCKRVLDAELGMEPEPATEMLREQIRAGTFTAPTRTRSLPAGHAIVLQSQPKLARITLSRR